VEISELPTAEVDPLQMQVLFQYLISNALKYRGEQKPEIKIHGADCSDGTYLDRIFRPFQRLHGRQSGYGGTGMGLAICLKIVQRHSGSIAASS